MKNYFNLYGWINITASLTLFYFGITNQNLKPHEKLIVCLFAIIIVGIYCVVLLQLNRHDKKQYWVITETDIFKRVNYNTYLYSFDKESLYFVSDERKAIKFDSKEQAEKFIYDNHSCIRKHLNVKLVYL